MTCAGCGSPDTFGQVIYASTAAPFDRSERAICGGCWAKLVELGRKATAVREDAEESFLLRYRACCGE